MSESPTILKAQNVHKSYRMGATRVVVLKGVDLAVRQGEFVAIIGASGSGKSTLLHILGGLDRPDKGTVQFQNRDVNRLSARELNQYRNETVGFVFQFYHLLDELNVLENVVLPAMISRSVLGWLVARTKPGGGARSYSNNWDCGTGPSTSRTSCRAASGNAWPSAGP